MAVLQVLQFAIVQWVPKVLLVLAVSAKLRFPVAQRVPAAQMVPSVLEVPRVNKF